MHVNTSTLLTRCMHAGDGSCDDGLKDIGGVCLDPTAPPPPPCGAPGEPCCTGVNIPFDSNGCDPDNNCEFPEDDFSGPGVCEPCGTAGIECCTIQNDDILTQECSEEDTTCGPEGVCVSDEPDVPPPPPDDGCGSLDELCCVSDAGFSCDDDLVCDTNVQGLLGPGVCRECGALDELPCSAHPCLSATLCQGAPLAVIDRSLPKASCWMSLQQLRGHSRGADHASCWLLASAVERFLQNRCPKTTPN